MTEPANVLEIPDAGMITVKIPGGGTASVDAYACWNRVVEIQQANADEDGGTRGFHEKVAAVLAEFGLPPLNHYQVDRFVQSLRAAVDELGKAAGQPGPTPNSPGSTGPASSDCPRE